MNKGDNKKNLPQERDSVVPQAFPPKEFLDAAPYWAGRMKQIQEQVGVCRIPVLLRVWDGVLL